MPGVAAKRSALDELKPPEPSKKAKTRKVSVVEPSARAPRGPAASVADKVSTLCKITPAQRIREFPDQGLCLDLNNKRLVCCDPCNASYGTAAGGELSGIVELFKRVRIANPFTAYLMSPNEDSVRKLAAAFPVLLNDKQRVAQLVAELPTYLALCQPLRLPPCPEKTTFQTHRDKHISLFYATNAAQIPAFSSLMLDVGLLTASSAAAERVFSLLSNSFGNQQLSAYEDLIETSLMIQCRRRQEGVASADAV